MTAKLNDPSLIDPKKLRGKFIPEKENTDISADPIDSPPEKSFKKDLPKPDAKFEKKEKDTRPINSGAIWLAILFTLVSAISASIIPIRGLAPAVQLATALAGLFFNLENSHLQAKTFPRLGFNPLHLITALDCILILTGAYQLLIFFLSFGNA